MQKVPADSKSNRWWKLSCSATPYKHRIEHRYNNHRQDRREYQSADYRNGYNGVGLQGRNTEVQYSDPGFSCDDWTESHCVV